MHWSEIRNHRFFELTPERSRSHLRWARVLALVLGIASLVTAMPALLVGGTIGQRTMGLALLAQAIAYLALGPRAGRGDVRAAGVMLGLALVGILVARTSYVLLPIIGIWIFGQGFRGAVALAPRSPRTASDGSPDVGEWFARGRRALNQSFGRAPRRSVFDFIVGAILLAASYRSFRAAARIDPGGDMFGIGSVIMVFALVGTVLGLLLLIAATGGFTGKRWAKTVRTVAYVPLVTLCVLASPLVIDLLKGWFRS